jgi:spore coat polysaccharide biosynthesis protein SpsF
VLGWVVRAARESGAFDEVVVATSTDPTDDVLEDAAIEMGARVVRGPLDDVLSRFVMAIEELQPDAIARLTADNPLVDPAVIRLAVRAFDPVDLDYLSTGRIRSLPLGLDVEVCSSKALLVAGDRATGVDREHVTSYLYALPGRFRVAGLVIEPSSDRYRLTLDTPEDAALLDAVVAHTGDNTLSVAAIIEFLDDNPQVASLNRMVRQKSIDDR